MAVKIRLRKISDTAKKRYNFRVVVMEEGDPRDGRVIEEIGYYDPSKKPALLKIDLEKFRAWQKKGAQATSTLTSLVRKMK